MKHCQRRNKDKASKTTVVGDDLGKCVNFKFFAHLRLKFMIFFHAKETLSNQKQIKTEKEDKKPNICINYTKSAVLVYSRGSVW